MLPLPFPHHYVPCLPPHQCLVPRHSPPLTSMPCKSPSPTYHCHICGQMTVSALHCSDGIPGSIILMVSVHHRPSVLSMFLPPLICPVPPTLLVSTWLPRPSNARRLNIWASNCCLCSGRLWPLSLASPGVPAYITCDWLNKRTGF